MAEKTVKSSGGDGGGRRAFYVTTPIYYVNDRPHIGHIYTTLLADALARFHRLAGRDVFFLTGTDEHADKVAQAAKERGRTFMEWADENAAAFQRAFEFMGCSNDDFIRTTQERHKSKVLGYIRLLMETEDVYLGDYVGWWDASQEEYLTENVAREAGFKSPVTGRPLEKRTEKNYFFRLSKFEARLLEHIEKNPRFILPEARRNEVLGRIRQGLQDVPISRAVAAGDEGWGILMPGDESHRVYVWIDALFNYLSAVDTPEREQYWPADVHMIGKDILWFHAVIWPALLMALGRELPGTVYAHSYWIREGRKMSKSLGNFLDLPTLRAYCDAYSRDAVRWYLLTQGPLGATDADFAHAKFVEVYNADLANGIGNAFSRVANMIGKYFEGECPDDADMIAQGEIELRLGGQMTPRAATEFHTNVYQNAMRNVHLSVALITASGIVRSVDAYINATEPFKIAKDPARKSELAIILYQCAEALRIAATIMLPAMPDKMGEALSRMGQRADGDGVDFAARTKWGGLKPGTKIEKGEALFQRADPDAPAPSVTGDGAGATSPQEASA